MNQFLRVNLLWTLFWIVLALVFGAGVYHIMGAQAGLAFFAAYGIEKSLSLDNLFVFLIILNRFNFPPQDEQKVLLYGIIGAVLLRGIFIFVGLSLVKHFSWVFYIFGILLVMMGVKIFISKKESHAPMSLDFLKLSPFTLAIITIIWSDIIFALDSIPAVLAVTSDLFIAYTSNIFAILGLKSLFIVLKQTAKKLAYVKFSIGIITIFVGLKMLLMDVIHIPTEVSCAIIFLTLLLGIGVSLFVTRK